MKLHRGIKIFIGSTVIIFLAALIIYLFFRQNVVALVLGIPQPAHRVQVQRNVMIPMRDGTDLAADIYRPASPGAFPVILTRTPYNKRNPAQRYEFIGELFASQGFVYIVQDVRGRFDSGGEFYPFINESTDGVDTIRWAGTQKWSSGKVGMFGLSYFGATQWLAAPYEHTYLKALIPIVTAQNTYRSWLHNGVFRYNQTLLWHYLNEKRHQKDIDDIDWNKAIWNLPLIDADNISYHDNPIYNDWISHPLPDSFWNPMRADIKADRIEAPALIIGGWYDPFVDASIEDYRRLITSGEKSARKSQLIIGPWIHVTRSTFDDVDFGNSADFMQQVRVMLSWYRQWLSGESTGMLNEKPIRIFIMGRNEWRSEAEWPPKRAEYVSFYLHSNGNANSSLGDGTLTTSAPEAEKPDTFIYDPEIPVPSVGGAFVYENISPGPADQRDVEIRKDVLVYSTPPLEKDTEITGPVKLILYASSSARDTDFTVKLIDVYPDGKSINIKSGIIRARFRNSLQSPSFLEKGTVYRFEIVLGATSNLFVKGHRIRLFVSSSDFPLYDRNLNTGEIIGKGVKMVKAIQTVFHEEDYQSRLVLPVIPQGG